MVLHRRPALSEAGYRSSSARPPRSTSPHDAAAAIKKNTAKTVKVDGVAIVFAGFDVLVKTKDTDRLQDQADIERLKQIKGK